MELTGKNAVVTGGSHRIGRSIALALAREGAHVIIHTHSSLKEGEATAEEIRKLGRQTLVSQCDLSDPTSVETWFAALSTKMGGIDVLVNSASSYTQDRYETMKKEDLSKSMMLHVFSPLILIRMMAAQAASASVVNILDSRIADGDPAHASYHLGKRGLFTLTKDLAQTLAPALRINGVAPGLILPPQGQDESWIEKLKTSNPLMNRGTPQDIAAAVLYLISADFVTGQIIYVDGGRHLKGTAYGL